MASGAALAGSPDKWLLGARVRVTRPVHSSDTCILMKNVAQTFTTTNCTIYYCFFFTCNWCIFVNILNCKLLGSLHVGLYAFGWRFKLSCGQRLTTLQSHFRLPVLIYISIAYHTVCFEGQSESLNRDERQLSVSRRTTLARALFAAAKPELNIFFLSALPIDKFSWLWCHSTLVLSFSLNSSCFMSKSTSSFLA